MNKKRNEELIKKANDALNNTQLVKIFKDEQAKNAGIIKDSYNGQTAALGVTIAMTGLRPALAIYQKETEGCKRIEILNAIAVMLEIKPQSGKKPGEELFKKTLQCNAEELKVYKRDILDCSIALKQVIRTYKLSDNEN